MDSGLNECLSINERVAAANEAAFGLKEKLGSISRAALAVASAGLAGLGAGGTSLKTAADDALKLNKDAADVASQVTNATHEASQVAILREPTQKHSPRWISITAG